MSRYKIIDVFSSFFCCDTFQQAGGGNNESSGGDFFTGYVDAEKYVSGNFDCSLNRPLVIPTGIEERYFDNQDKKENAPGEIQGS